MKAWHFLKSDSTTGEGNLLVKVGQTLRVDSPVKLCRHGLHFSLKPADALKYAPGPIVQLVEVPDNATLGNDKGVAAWRKCLWKHDATNLLHEFACQSAEAALMIADVTDISCWNAIHAKREWIAGRLTDQELVVAREFARAAAWDAARYAAWYAARAAAWDAAWDAARAAAWDAAKAAAWDAAWDDLNKNLVAMLKEAGAPI